MLVCFPKCSLCCARSLLMLVLHLPCQICVGCCFLRIAALHLLPQRIPAIVNDFSHADMLLGLDCFVNKHVEGCA